MDYRLPVILLLILVAILARYLMLRNAPILDLASLGKSKHPRTSGYRNWMNRRCYLPTISENNIACFEDGARYLIRKAGWLRLKDAIPAA